MADTLPFRERITCSVAQAAEAAGISEPTVWRMIRAGKLATVKIGGRRLVRVSSLIALLDPPASP